MSRLPINDLIDGVNEYRLQFREWAKDSIFTRAAILGTCNLAANFFADYTLEFFARPLNLAKWSASFIPGVNYLVNKLGFIELIVKGNFMEKGRRAGEVVVGEDSYLASKEGDPEKQDAIRSTRLLGDIIGLFGCSLLFSAGTVALLFPYAQVVLQSLVDYQCKDYVDAIGEEEPVSPSPQKS